jgi:hypothetical protein
MTDARIDFQVGLDKEGDGHMGAEAQEDLVELQGRTPKES